MTEARVAAEPRSPWERTADEVLAFAPNWLVFWGDGIATSQLATWVPYLRRSRYRYVLASAIDEIHPGVAALVRDLPNVLVASPFEDVRNTLRRTPGLEGVIYPTTRSPNFGVVTALPDVSHVWIGHGESEKGVNGVRTASLYDSVFVARYSAVGRFPRSIRPWVGRGACAIGAPIVEGIDRSPWAAPREVRTILYAPTWEGRKASADYSSLPEVVPVLKAAMPALASRGIRVILRPHPGTGHREPSYSQLVRELYAAGLVKAGSKVDDFAAADVMISDVSGVTAEFLFTEKPLIMPLTANLEARNKDAGRIAREYPWAYRWPVGTQDLVGLLDGLARSDPLRGRRARSARDMYRGHRSLDEAVRTFDTALASAFWRRGPLPVRWVFAAKLHAAPLVNLAERALRGLRRRRRARRHMTAARES